MSDFQDNTFQHAIAQSAPWVDAPAVTTLWVGDVPAAFQADAFQAGAFAGAVAGIWQAAGAVTTPWA